MLENTLPSDCCNFLLLMFGINGWGRNVWIWPFCFQGLSCMKTGNILSLWCLQVWRCLWIQIKPKLALESGCLINTRLSLPGLGSSVREPGRSPEASPCNRFMVQLPAGSRVEVMPTFGPRRFIKLLEHTVWTGSGQYLGWMKAAEHTC